MAESKYWALVPAAGVGARMGAEVPKQYLKLGSRRVIDHALERLSADPRICGVLVALAEHDAWWQPVTLRNGLQPRRVHGGAERCHSVLNGLRSLEGEADDRDWVLVHDAARPCVHPADIQRLMNELADHPVGGLLGVAVRDTMKRTDSSGNVTDTVNREGLWHALTPQMFRYGLLTRALRAVISSGRLVTDEAQAVELAGEVPKVVEGRPDNIKITRPEDMPLAELFLRRQAEEP